MGRKGGCAHIAPWPRPADNDRDNDRERGQEQRWGNDKMMTCVQLALTAQLICFSDHAFVCTDNGSLAHLIGVSACTGPDRSQANDDRRRVPDQRDLAVPVSTTGNSTSCGCVSPDSMGLYEDQTRPWSSRGCDARSTIGIAQSYRAVTR